MNAYIPFFLKILHYQNFQNSTRAVNRQPGYRPGRLVEPFAFNKNRDRDNDIHIHRHRQPQTHTHTHTSDWRRQQRIETQQQTNRNSDKGNNNKKQKQIHKERLQAEVIEKHKRTNQM